MINNCHVLIIDYQFLEVMSMFESWFVRSVYDRCVYFQKRENFAILVIDNFWFDGVLERFIQHLEKHKQNYQHFEYYNEEND